MTHSQDPLGLPVYGKEVARFLLPMPVRGMDRLATSLEGMYGKGLLMHQDEQWLLVTRPAAPDLPKDTQL